MNKMRIKYKIEKPLTDKKWSILMKVYHNKSSEHFFLGSSKKSSYIAGHDMTTHPPLKKKNGKPKNRFVPLQKNPNPYDKRKSYINRHLRVVKEYYEDTGNRRLVKKKRWKVSKQDRSKVKKMDRKKSAHLNLG